MEKGKTHRSNTEEFVKKAQARFGDKYDYSKVNYLNNKTKVCIICPEHGEFWQTPNTHLREKGCPICSKNKNAIMLRKNGEQQKLTTENFIEKARKIHGDKYDYSKVNYVNNYTKVEIICPIHGSFFQKPSNHLSGNGCQKCSNDNQKLGIEGFIGKAKKIHDDKYDYSKVEYINNHTKVCIICPEHGEFWQKPNTHLNGEGCPKCGKEKNGKYRVLTKESVLNKFRCVHGDKYDYSNFEYLGYDKKCNVICKEHGMFLITPHSHIKGCGCKMCANKHLIGETRLKQFLEKNFENVLYQVKKDTKNFEWLEKQSLDFFIPSLNLAIEYQGEQHFAPIKYWGNDNKFSYTRNLDIKKFIKAQKNGIDIVYFRYGKIDIGDFPYNVIFNEEDLLTELLKRKKEY